MIHAAGYVRVSTEEQAQEGYSLDAQRRRIEEHCAARVWTLGEVYADEGVSGKEVANRPALLRLIDDAERGAFGAVVFWKIDRLSRRTRQLLEVCDKLEAAGVSLECITTPIENTPIGRFQRTILAGMSQWERETIVERIVENLGEKARQGWILGDPPIGYRRVGRNAIELDPETAPRVRELFELMASGGYSLDGLARWCESVGFRTARGLRYDKNKLRKVLTNPTYAGRISYHRRGHRGDSVTVEGRHEALIEAETFETVARLLSSRGPAASNRPRFGKLPYPLTGIARCGRCGTGMVGSVSQHGYRYVRCGTKVKLGEWGCKESGMRLDAALGVLTTYLSGMVLPEQAIRDVIDQLKWRQEQQALPADTGKLRRQLDRWRRLFVADEIDFETYKRESAALKAEIAAAEPSAAVLNVERAAVFLSDIGQTFEAMTTAEQRTAVHEVFAGIEIENSEITQIEPRLSYAPLFEIDRRLRFGTFARAQWPQNCVLCTPGRSQRLAIHNLAPALVLAA